MSPWMYTCVCVCVYVCERVVSVCICAGAWVCSCMHTECTIKVQFHDNSACVCVHEEVVHIITLFYVENTFVCTHVVHDVHEYSILLYTQPIYVAYACFDAKLAKHTLDWYP